MRIAARSICSPSPYSSHIVRRAPSDFKLLISSFPRGSPDGIFAWQFTSVPRGLELPISPLMSADSIALLHAAIRTVPDFPKQGISFKDITPLLAHGKLFSLTIDAIIDTMGGQRVDKIVAIDARGFIFAGAVADRLKTGFVPVRKKGKLPWHTIGTAYSLEYGENVIEMHRDALAPGERVWLVDDVLATGGTSAAAAKLVGQLGGELAGMTFLIELGFLNGRSVLPSGVPVHGVLIY